MVANNCNNNEIVLKWVIFSYLLFKFGHLDLLSIASIISYCCNTTILLIGMDYDTCSRRYRGGEEKGSNGDTTRGYDKGRMLP